MPKKTVDILRSIKKSKPLLPTWTLHQSSDDPNKIRMDTLLELRFIVEYPEYLEDDEYHDACLEITPNGDAYLQDYDSYKDEQKNNDIRIAIISGIVAFVVSVIASIITTLLTNL